MSSQDNDGISLNFSHEQQNFRLLELPTALLELVTSRNPPTLSLKSLPIRNIHSPSPAPNAVLCTHDQTFHIRQVHSSNSLYILQPSTVTLPAGNATLPSPAISAVAQCTATLELLPSSPNAVSFLRQVLPVYHEEHFQLGPIGKAYNTTSSETKMKSKFAILAEAPLSADEFEKGWMELCAFELESQAFLPSAPSLCNVWKSLVTAAAVKGVQLEGRFRVVDVAELIEEDGYPCPLLEAVTRRLNIGLTSGTKNIIFAQEQCARWVGNTLLEVLSQRGDAVVIMDFLQQWRGQLPEGWRSSATLSVIDGSYRQLEDDKIVFSQNVSLDERLEQHATAAVPVKGPRKWHEKFKNARR